ncbi:MAG: ketopantoate reductase family protein [Clostridia bacterium]|nr:ketopantoate reductase family protein [Clostridia bacterium]
MRILIYGAGVIGSLYAARLSEAGYDVTVFARGKRLLSLQSGGLLYKADGMTRRADVHVTGRLENGDRYDLILLTVRENQLYDALKELKPNVSPTIVTMVNTLKSYGEWDKVCGEGRILPAFPGAGGGFEGDVLDAAFTPRIVQPTTVGRRGGKEKTLAAALKGARIPFQIVDDMHAWQICHLAMVVPIADAYYEALDPENAGRDRALMKKTALRIKKNLRDTAKKGVKLSPAKMNAFVMLPAPLVAFVPGRVFQSRFGEVFMYRHSMKAPDEMRRLHDGFYGFISGADPKSDFGERQ